jgi:outer membrane usher protein FimD/PapC
VDNKSLFFCQDFLHRLIFFFAFALIPGVPAEAHAEQNPAMAFADASAPELAAAFESQGHSTTIPELSKETTPLVVNVSVNKETKGDFFAERDSNGELYFTVEDLVTLKLLLPRNRVVLVKGEKYAPLSALLEISYSFDEKNLVVSILGKTSESGKTSIELYSPQSRPQNLYHPRETSAFMNYGLIYSYADPVGFTSFSASNKIGARAGDLFLISDSLYTKTETSERFVRLSTSATYERRNDLQWLVFGDQFANSGDLGSSVNMGGIGFSKLYRLDPYFITQPMFNISGVTQFPSEAAIYMDGVLVSRQTIAPGQFELKNVYSYTGPHRVDVVLKDPFGNERKFFYPLYMSTQLLREGLHEYSYNAGFLREQYGVESNEYGKPVFSAFHRYGVTSAFNLGLRAEGSNGIYNGGLSTPFSLPRLGVFVLSVAGSSADGVKGSAGSLQHSYQLGSFSTDVQLREYSRNYATVGAPPSPEMTKYAASLSAGFQLGDLGGFSLGYSANETHARLTTRMTSASYSRGLTRSTSLFATLSNTRTTETVNAVYIGLNFSLDHNLRGSMQFSKTGESNTETLQLQKDLPIGEGLGYRAALNRSDSGASTSSSFNPALQYNARHGIYNLDSTIQNTGAAGTTETYNLSAAGAIVYAGGFFGFSRPINDSFTIVKVGNLPDVTVRNNGQELGTTDSSGTLIAPTLASYGQNQITVDVKNMPPDYSVSTVNQGISPPAWSGSCVSFDVVKVRAMTGTLFIQNADKKSALEFVDILMNVGDRKMTFPTGKGGEFYMENSLPEEATAVAGERQSCSAIAERRRSGGNVIMPGTYQARVGYEGGNCEFTITFRETDEPITEVGEVVCTPVETRTP